VAACLMASVPITLLCNLLLSRFIAGFTVGPSRNPVTSPTIGLLSTLQSHGNFDWGESNFAFVAGK
jgi:hypothetical protein